MKNKLRTIFLTWWVLPILGMMSVNYFDIPYDAGGFEDLIWWGTFFIGFPYGVSGEVMGSLLPNAPDLLVGSLAFIFGSLFIYLLYRIVLWALRGRK